MKKIFVIPFIAIGIFSATACSENNEQNSKEQEEQKEEKDSTSEAASSTPSPFLGETAQIMIGTKEFDKTVRFYDILGWEIQESGTTPWKWTQLYDGSTTILVNEDTTTYMGPSYHASNGEEVYEKMKELGVSPMIEVPSEDGKPWFNVYFAPDTVGFSVINEEASPKEEVTVADLFYKSIEKIQFPNKVSGVYQEYAVSVENLEEAMAYWEKLGFESSGVQKTMYDYAIMYDGAFILGLHETKGMWHGQMLTYSGHSEEENNKAIELLKSQEFNDITPIEFQGQVYPGNYIVYDPAGNAFFLTTDFSKMKAE